MSTLKQSDENGFIAVLEEKTQRLHECQVQKGQMMLYQGESYGSCLTCPDMFGCPIRTEYVNAVYASMNKGATGGFEF